MLFRPATPEKLDWLTPMFWRFPHVSSFSPFFFQRCHLCVCEVMWCEAGKWSADLFVFPDWWTIIMIIMYINQLIHYFFSYLFNHALLRLLGNIIKRVFCMIFLWKGDVQPVPVVVEAEVLGHPNILLATKRNHRSKGGWIMLNQSSRKKGSPRIQGLSTHHFRYVK